MDMAASVGSGYVILDGEGTRRDARAGPLSDKKRHSDSTHADGIEPGLVSH